MFLYFSEIILEPWTFLSQKMFFTRSIAQFIGYSISDLQSAGWQAWIIQIQEASSWVSKWQQISVSRVLSSQDCDGEIKLLH